MYTSFNCGFQKNLIRDKGDWISILKQDSICGIKPSGYYMISNIFIVNQWW